LAFCCIEYGTLLQTQVGHAPLIFTLINFGHSFGVVIGEDLIYKCKDLTTSIQTKRDMKNSFSYSLAVYSVQLEVKLALSLRLSGWCVVTVRNLMSAIPLKLQHPMALSNTFIHSFPSKRKLHRHGNNF